MTGNDELQWFVMRDLQRKSKTESGEKLSAWEYVRAKGFEVFVPMKWEIAVRNGKRKRRQVPAIRDLVFLHGKREEVDPISKSDIGLTYRFVKGAPYGTPMTVREAEMNRFIAAVNGDSDPRFLSPDDITEASIGSRVEVIGGPMSGSSGRLLKIRGSKKRRIIVAIEGLIYAAIEVDPLHLKLLPN